MAKINHSDSSPDYSRLYRLLAQSNRGDTLTVRDDQFDFESLIDAAQTCRSRGGRFRLVDTGFLRTDQMEWLADSGADVYSSDSARRSAHELTTINKACRKGRAFLAYFHRAPVQGEVDKGLSASDLMVIGEAGTYLHLSDWEHEHDLSILTDLSHVCLGAGAWLVFYHHRPLSEKVAPVVASGSWLHLAGESLGEEGGGVLLNDCLKAAASVGTGVVLYIKEIPEISLLKDVLAKGGHLFFLNMLFDYRSPFREIEEKARLRPLDRRAYFLETTLLF